MPLFIVFIIFLIVSFHKKSKQKTTVMDGNIRDYSITILLLYKILCFV